MQEVNVGEEKEEVKSGIDKSQLYMLVLHTC